jgi:hypothetical protein
MFSRDGYNLPSTLWLRHGRAFTGTLLSCWLALSKPIAPAIARHKQLERLQLLFDAHTYRVLCDCRMRFDLPPLTVHALTPIL